MSASPISLYLDLPAGTAVDLEVAARASIAFSGLLKELAYILDPTLEVRVEMLSGTPGSLSIDSIIRAVHKRTHKNKTVKNDDGEEEKKEVLTILGVILAAATWMGAQLAEHTAQDLIDKVVGKDAHVQLTDADKADIVKRAAEAVQKNAARPQAQQVFREVERDTAIRAVGVTSGPRQKPANVVPRSEFPVRSGRVQIQETSVSRRVVAEHVRVALISPVLVPGDRRWKLRTAQGEFGATVKDKDFVERVLSGTTRVPMVAGIEMDVDLETTEDFVEGVWVPVERTVTHVEKLYAPTRQTSLPFAEPEDGDPE